jgi:hypothetical protein
VHGRVNATSACEDEEPELKPKNWHIAISVLLDPVESPWIHIAGELQLVL